MIFLGKAVFPKLEGLDIGIFRLGGPGIGNHLFTMYRGFSISKRLLVKYLIPNLMQLKLGPFLRFEDDKRIYSDLWFFDLKRIFHFGPKTLVVTSKSTNFKRLNIRHINDFKQFLIDKYQILVNPSYKFKVGVHFRTTDFIVSGTDTDTGTGLVNVRTPSEWFLRQLSALNPDASVVLFTDDKSNLELFKGVHNIEVDNSRNALEAIVNLSECEIILGSRSTFSLWAVVLGSGYFKFSPEFVWEDYFADRHVSCFQERVL